MTDQDERDYDKFLETGVRPDQITENLILLGRIQEIHRRLFSEVVGMITKAANNAHKRTTILLSTLQHWRNEMIFLKTLLDEIKY